MVPINCLFSPLGKRAYRALRTWSYNWTQAKGTAVEAAQKKAAINREAKAKKMSKGKNRGGNSNVGKGKTTAKSQRVNGDFCEDILDIRKQYFPIDPEVYQVMSPFIDEVSEFIPDILIDATVPGGGEGVAASQDREDLDPPPSPSPTPGPSPTPTPSPTPSPTPTRKSARLTPKKTLNISMFKPPPPPPPPPAKPYVKKLVKELKKPMPFAVKPINDFFCKPGSEKHQFSLSQKEGQVQYSAEVIDDVNDELHDRFVMTEIPSQDSDYRTVSLEWPEADSQTVEAAAGPEVDDTVPLGDSDAVLTAQSSTCAVSTASEPPCDTVSSMGGPSQPQDVEINSGNAAGASADPSAGPSAAEVTIPSSKSALYHSKQFKAPPQYIKTLFGGPSKIYKVRDIFTPSVLYKFQNKFRLAVYKHMKDGQIIQRRAVLSIIFHELDYAEADLDQRTYYHRFCDTGCDFVKHLKAKKDPQLYKKETTKDSDGNQVPWKKGVFAGMDSVVPLAFKQLCETVVSFANPTLISRCQTLRTTNANESIHSKIFSVINKRKKHGHERVVFGCQHVILAHNFGHLNSSFLHVLGTLSNTAATDLAYRDRESTRNASRTYANPRQWGKQGGGTGISHRKKVSRPVVPQPPFSGDEGVADSLPPSPPSPPHPPPPSTRRRAASAVISPWAISGEYGIGDD